MNKDKIKTLAARIGRNLLARIVLAMALGIGAAYMLPLWATRVFETFNAIFSQFL